MAIRAVTRIGMPILRELAKPVPRPAEIDRALIRDMIDTMYRAQGVGLAAPQVGVSLQIFVANPIGERGQELVLVNPRIIRRRGAVTEEEGCLSVPGYCAKVRRAKHVMLRAKDLQWRDVEVEASGLLARIFQHEVDHLSGKLYVDRLPFFARRKALKVIQAALSHC